MAASDRSRIQLVIATHGDLGCALLDVAESIAGAQPGVVCLALPRDQGVEAFVAQLRAMLAANGASLILVDMLGGTPWNVAVPLAQQHPAARVVSGVNLPMLLEVLLSRDGLDLDQLAQLAQQTAAQSAQVAGTPPLS